jgi:thiamine biosynthesis protein ThiS
MVDRILFASANQGGITGIRFLFFMKLTLNGKRFDTPKAETVQDLLDELRIESGRVAVEVDLTIVKKADYTAFKLKDGDNVEIVNFVGGG